MKSRDLSESLKNIITVEITRPQDTETLLEEFGAARASLYLEQFITLRQDFRERQLQYAFQEKSIKDFQFLAARCLMYHLLAILALTSFRAGAATINYASFMYGGFSFFLLMLIVFFARNVRLAGNRRSADDDYRSALRALLQRMGDEEASRRGGASEVYDAARCPVDMQG